MTILHVLMQDTVVAIKQGGDKLTVSNMDESKYPTATFSVDPKQVTGPALELHILMLAAVSWTTCGLPFQLAMIRNSVRSIHGSCSVVCYQAWQLHTLPDAAEGVVIICREWILRITPGPITS